MDGQAAMMELPEGDSQNDVCDTCGLRRWWHDQNGPQHEFRGAEDKVPQGNRMETPPEPPTPMRLGDPVLRAALIRRGVLNESDFDEAEAWLREAARQGKALIVDSTGYSLQEVEVVAKAVGKDAQGR
jgi:hypothetical protein